MKTSIIFASILYLAAAVPTPESAQLAKRTSYSDVANIGYASTNGGTTGGKGGTVVTVSTLAAFIAAANEKNSAPVIILVKGMISGSAQVRIGSNKSVIGLPGSGFIGVGLFIRRQKNVIIRNIISANVPAKNGDAISVQASTNIWLDHNELYSSLKVDKDFFDGLIDASHGSDWITISYTYFHDHWKTSLIGHSEKDEAEDKGHEHVTYANNYWRDLGSRAPSLRFGSGHIYNSYFQNLNTAINARQGAQILAQNNVFRNVTFPVESADTKVPGYVTLINNDLGGGNVTAPSGNLSPNFPPYHYDLIPLESVISQVPSEAGAKLSF